MSVEAVGPVIALAGDGVEIPPGIHDLACFRAWARSDEFPERGRIDWIAGRLEVDMTAEDLSTHGTPKSAIAYALIGLLQERQKGYVFIDRARLSNPEADLSAEPDVLVLLPATIESGAARLVPKTSGAPDRYVEIEGMADLVVEVVSDSSEARDAERLRDAYHRAGVREYWLVDARSPSPDLKILARKESSYVAARRGPGGWAHSRVLARWVRFVRSRRKGPLPCYRLVIRRG